MSLHALEDWTGTLLARLAPAARRQLLTRLARNLRRSQQQRLQAQRNPDGTAFVQRKPKPTLRGKQGRVKARMFTRLRLAKYLKATATDHEIRVGFGGRAARIAKVHQLGERDRPAPGQAAVKYPARQVLGLTPAELEQLREALLLHLAQ